MRRTQAGNVAWTAAIVVVLALAASCTGGSSDSDRSSATTTAPRLAPGTRLDASGLPAPVSDLARLGDLVAYLAPGRGADLQLVGVDPDTATVRWRHDAALVFASAAVSLHVAEVDGVVTFARRAAGGTGYALDAAEADGRVRWSAPIGRPVGFAQPCDRRLCIETVDGPVRIDPKTGKHEAGVDVDASTGLALSSTTEPSLVRIGHPGADGGEEIVSAPQFDDGPSWSVRLFDLLATDDEDWEASVPAERYGDQWVVGAFRNVLGRVERYGNWGPGDLLALSAADGTLRWHRPGADLCPLPGAEELIIRCVQAKIAANAAHDAGYRITEVAALDPKTGADRIRIPLVPYDPVEGGAFAVTGQDRMLMVTPSGVQDVDLAAGVARPATEGQVGWCRRQADLPKVHVPGGTDYEVYARAFGRPCALDGTKLDDEALLAPIVVGDLPPVDGVSSIAVGPWVLWNDAGTLAGVVTDR